VNNEIVVDICFSSRNDENSKRNYEIVVDILKIVEIVVEFLKAVVLVFGL